MISIAMATFNGERYIEKQLNSILRYTGTHKLEVVISDDGSLDSTLSILNRFIDTNMSSNITLRLVHNKYPGGISSNFNNALVNCSGKYVFLADQDDEWFSLKLNKFSAMFDTDQECVAICCDTIFFSEESDKELNKSKLNEFDRFKLNKDNYVMGCAHAFRANYLKSLLPIPDNTISHDDYLVYPSIIMGNRVIINEPLQYYRIHQTNSSNFFINYSWKYPLIIVVLLRYGNIVRSLFLKRNTHKEVLRLRFEAASNFPDLKIHAHKLKQDLDICDLDINLLNMVRYIRRFGFIRFLRSY